MTWLIIVIVAYFLNAVAAIVDKYLISKRVPQPAVYAFSISILGILSVFLIPFGFAVPKFLMIFWSLAAGISFTFALFFLFTALKFGETTKITPFIGGLQPIFIFALSYFFLRERLAANQIIAFIFLVAGTIFISCDFNGKKVFKENGLLYALLSTILFAVSYFLTKFVFQSVAFIPAFVWIRFGSVFGALLFLIPSEARGKIFNTFKSREGRRKGTSQIFFLGQICGAFSFFLINYAIKLNSVSLTNALQGIQYVFLITMVIILSKKFPHILEEKLTFKILLQKITAIIFISIGLICLTL